MNSWYTRSYSQKVQMTQLKRGRDPNPHTPTHTSCLSRWIVLMRMEETMELLKDCLRICHDSTTLHFLQQASDHRGIYKEAKPENNSIRVSPSNEPSPDESVDTVGKAQDRVRRYCFKPLRFQGGLLLQQ